jgi:hypothetical protein
MVPDFFNMKRKSPLVGKTERAVEADVLIIYL